MNIPGFHAETGVYSSGNHYQSWATGISGQSGRVEAALMGRLGFTCSGSCPTGQLLVTCDNACQCCIGGGRCTLNGDVLCQTNPAPAGGGLAGFARFSPGGALR
jgi:hypothetical protein